MPYHLATPHYGTVLICDGWGGRIRTYEMSPSKGDALPLGDTPLKKSGVSKESRTLDLQSHNLAL